MPSYIADRELCDTVCDDDFEDRVLESIRNNKVWTQKGARVGLSRFAAVHDKMVSVDPDWTLREFGTMCALVQAGKWTESRMDKVLALCQKANEPALEALGALGANMKAKNKDAVKKLREVCDNTLEIAAYFYANRDHQVKCRIFSDIAEPGFHFMKVAARKLRGGGGTLHSSGRNGHRLRASKPWSPIRCTRSRSRLSCSAYGF